MKYLDQKNKTVDLRGVRSKAQKRIEQLRLRAREVTYSIPQTSREVSQDVIGGSLRVLGIAIIAFGSWTYGPGISASLSYFVDTEGSASLMTTGFIDLLASSSPETIELECVGVEDRWVYLESTGNEANISGSVFGMTSSSTLCKAVELEVRESGNTIYNGLLQDFYVEDIEGDELRFLMRLADDAGPFEEGGEMCTTSIEFLAVQERHGGEVGFSDSEVIELAFYTDEENCGDDCEEDCEDCCCGDLYVDITNINDGTVINIVDVNASTGGNEANGEEGEIDSGDADASVEIETILNTNETTIIQDCDCGCCEEEDECVCEDSCEGTSACGEEAQGEEVADIEETDDADNEEGNEEAEGVDTEEDESGEIDIQEEFQNRMEEIRSRMQSS